MAELPTCVVVDYNSLFCLGLRESSPGNFELAAEASDATTGASVAIDIMPDVVLMNVAVEGFWQIATERIIKASPDTKVLILSNPHRPGETDIAFASGAAGIVEDTGTPQELASCIRVVAQGHEHWGVPWARRQIELANGAPLGPGANLTEMQCKLIDATARGLTTAEIAKEVEVTERTVRRHVEALRTRFKAANDASLVLNSICEGVPMHRANFPPKSDTFFVSAGGH